MDPDVKAEWLKALRSMEYVQGRGRLRFNLRFCCLGVLCDLHSPSEWVQHSSGLAYYQGYAGTAPDPVLDWCGLKHADAVELADKNDDGSTFAEIADWIEENL